MTSVTETEPLLTVAETAAMLGVPRQRCYELIARGGIPSVRLSARRIRIPRAALDAWIAEQAAASLRRGGS